MRQQRSANITCFKCGQKAHNMQDYPNLADTSPVSGQALSVSIYSMPTMVTQMMIASYAIPQSSLASILKQLVKVKQKTAN